MVILDKKGKVVKDADLSTFEKKVARLDLVVLRDETNRKVGLVGRNATTIWTEVEDIRAII